MDTTKTVEYARQLVAAHGAAAEAEAAQRALDLEKSGKTEEAEQWRKVRAAIALMKPARVS